MKKTLFLLIALIVFSSHDMFLKLDTYFLAPNSSAIIKLYNGTFEKSENVIARNRMLDVSLVSNGVRTQLDTAQWSEKDSMTILSLQTGDEGTAVVGVSTKARNIELAADAFNSYLEHDGVLDMIKWRKENEAEDQDAVEKYSKHVKSIVQIGNKKTDDWSTLLGYPIEFVPLTNPYELHTGDEIKVRLLANGKPLVNQLVYVGTQAPINGHTHDHEEGEEADHEHDEDTSHEHVGKEESSQDHADSHEHSHDNETAHVHDDGGHSHEHAEGEEHGHSHESTHEHGVESAHEHGDENHTHAVGNHSRTDENGVVSVKLASDGIWYLRTINLQLSDEPGLTHESNWATLTFEVGHDHGNSNEAHVHEDESPFGIPGYAYWLGSFALIGILFFYFYKKN